MEDGARGPRDHRGDVLLYGSSLRNDRVRLTVEDVERHGPGIVADVTGTRRNRSRALVWAESTHAVLFMPDARRDDE